MSVTICVHSETSGRMLRAVAEDGQAVSGDLVIIESDLGGDLARVIMEHSPICQHAKAEKNAVRVVRKATDEDIRKFEWLADKEGKAFDLCLERIKAHNLNMKLVSVRYFFSEKKGIFYYTADARVDFRELVKDLAKELKMRIEMRQVGVRDEAKMIGGLGVCGRALCCYSFIQEFAPVTIQKARRQQIVINPTKISGVCGRLMCCLAFEEETHGRLFIQDEEQFQNED